MPVILGGNTGIYLASLAPSASPLLLDTYPNASVAYSLRKLRTAYTGSAIRVRRSSDNAEQNIGYDSNNVLDTASLLSFVGYNLFTYSEDISQSQYTKQQLNTTGTPAYLNVETAPDGTLTADKLIENTVNSQHTIYQSAVLTGFTPGIDHNVSVYLKAAERTAVKIFCDIDGVGKSCIVDLTNGSVSSSNFVISPVVTSVGNGWYRFSVTQSSNTFVANFAPRIFLLNSSNQDSYLGDGTSGVYVWGFQLTRTSSVQTYSKTAATANAGNGFVTTWYDQSGNARNITQSTAANQPQIVLSGAVLTQNTKPTLAFNGTSNILRAFSSGTSTENTLITLSKATSTATAYQCIATIGGIAAANPLSYLLINAGAIVTKRAIYSDTGATSVDGNSTTNFELNQIFNTTNSVSMFVNNNSETITNNTRTLTSNLNNIQVGSETTYNSRFGGNISEIIHYASNQVANQVGIASNINTYYSVY